MTREELEKEATEYAQEWGDKTDGTYASCRDGYLAGAEPREKRIVELEKENSELKKKCYKKAVKDYCKLEKENAELKADNDARKFAMVMSENVEKNCENR